MSDRFKPEDFEIIESKQIYKGSLVALYKDRVKHPDGAVYSREVIRGVRAVAIVALTAYREVILIRQYRHPGAEVIYEIPAGLIDEGEIPLVTAARELEEETGYRAERFEHLVDFYTTPGYSDEIISLFLATGATDGTAAPQADEFIEVVKVALDEAIRMIDGGEIRDGKTIAGLLLAERRA